MRHISAVIILIFLILMMVNQAAHAQFKKAGSTGYVFLEIPVTPRMAALGETAAAFTDAGAEALFTNPSLLGFTKNHHNVYAAYGNYLSEMQHQGAGYALQISGIGVLGISVNHLDMGEMVRTINADPTNPGGRYLVVGNYTAEGLALGLTYARRLTPDFAFGLTARYVQETIAEYRSTNVVMDMGMVYRTGFRSLRLGGYIQNFGVDSKYVGDTFKMPIIFRLGIAMEVLGSPDSPTRLTLALDALHPSDYSERLHAGAEYWFQNFIALRGGYKFNYDDESYTTGIGLRWRQQQTSWGIDISYTDYGRLGSVLRFGLSGNF